MGMNQICQDCICDNWVNWKCHNLWHQRPKSFVFLLKLVKLGNKQKHNTQFVIWCKVENHQLHCTKITINTMTMFKATQFCTLMEILHNATTSHKMMTKMMSFLSHQESITIVTAVNQRQTSGGMTLIPLKHGHQDISNGSNHTFIVLAGQDPKYFGWNCVLKWHWSNLRNGR